MSTVAIQGVRGSYSEQAARKILGGEARILECADFAETFESVAARRADYAVVPLRNKIVGEIADAVEIFRKTDLRILDELRLEIDHVLVATTDAEFENLKTVRSHVEALRQCRRFLAENSQLEQITAFDTAGSVREISEAGDARHAAIASRRAAEIYGARVLRENIADEAENWTLFYLIGN